jgi:hypothetical protein
MTELGDADRLLAAKIMGTALHHARWRELSADEETAAVTALFDLAAGRADLLAYAAGILAGASEGALDEPRRRQAADLLLKAGADPGLIPQWIEVGRHRARAARQIPHTGIAIGRYSRRSGGGLVRGRLPEQPGPGAPLSRRVRRGGRPGGRATVAAHPILTTQRCPPAWGTALELASGYPSARSPAHSRPAPDKGLVACL